MGYFIQYHVINNDFEYLLSDKREAKRVFNLLKEQDKTTKMIKELFFTTDGTQDILINPIN